MKRSQALITMILTLTALTALAATASAAEKTLILPEPTGASPVTFTSTSGIGKLEITSGTTLTCQKDKGLGSFTTPNLGSGSVLFEECKSSQETTCTGIGDAAGTIEQKGELHFILALEMLTATTSTLVPAFAVLVNQFHFTCKNTELGIELLVLLRGCIAGVQDGGEGLLAKTTVLFALFTKGENKILSILMETKTVETKCLLETSISEEKVGEKFLLSALIGSAQFTWARGGVAITVLLMDK